MMDDEDGNGEMMMMVGMGSIQNTAAQISYVRL
jgi:hypothetical protein